MDFGDDDDAPPPQERSDRRWWVRRFMKQFFQDKFYHLPDFEGNPQPIPDDKLFTEFNLSLVASELEMNGEPVPVYNLMYSYDLIEAAIRRHIRNGRYLLYHEVTTKRQLIEYQLWLLRECERKRIPKQFFGGMILLYTWLCEGVPFDTTSTPESYEKKKSLAS